jgi:hypothetical protein
LCGGLLALGRHSAHHGLAFFDDLVAIWSTAGAGHLATGKLERLGAITHEGDLAPVPSGAHDANVAASDRRREQTNGKKHSARIPT